MLASKLGLSSLDHAEDDALVSDLFDLLQKVETDMTLFFRGLMELPVNVAEGGIDNSGRIEGGALPEPLRPAFYDEDQASAPEAASRLAGWLRRYSERVRLEKEPTVLRYQRMSQQIPSMCFAITSRSRPSRDWNGEMGLSWRGLWTCCGGRMMSSPNTRNWLAGVRNGHATRQDALHSRAVHEGTGVTPYTNYAVIAGCPPPSPTGPERVTKYRPSTLKLIGPSFLNISDKPRNSSGLAEIWWAVPSPSSS